MDFTEEMMRKSYIRGQVVALNNIADKFRWRGVDRVATTIVLEEILRVLNESVTLPEGKTNEQKTTQQSC